MEIQYGTDEVARKVTAILIYSIVALLIVSLTAWLVRQRREEGLPTVALHQEDYVRDLWENGSLRLAERLFDSTDHLWLRDEIGQPKLARVLTRERKQMALRWLHALRRSFNDLVRVPESDSARARPGDVPANWQLLRLTLRFHFLLTYAVFVVRLFGPYHRLIPSADWLRFFPKFESGKAAYSPAEFNDKL